MNIAEALKTYAEQTGAAVEADRVEWCPRCQEHTLQVPSDVTRRDFTELYGVVSYSIQWKCSVCKAVTFTRGWQQEE